MKHCTTHHDACACREAKYTMDMAVLKAEHTCFKAENARLKTENTRLLAATAKLIEESTNWQSENAALLEVARAAKMVWDAAMITVNDSRDRDRCNQLEIALARLDKIKDSTK